MTTWQETEQLSRELRRLANQGRTAALATVVRIEGSTYRRPGARLLLRDDASTWGQVSGGCLEADLGEIGRSLLESDSSRLVHYDTSGPEDALWGFGLGCQGKIDVAVFPCRGEGFWRVWSAVTALLTTDQPFVLAVSLPPDRGPADLLVCDRSGVLETTAERPFQESLAEQAALVLSRGASVFETVAGREVFLEYLQPPPTLVICGAGDDSIPLVALAAQSGFRVTVLDHRPAYLTAERFPAASLVLGRASDPVPFPVRQGTLVVLKTHSLEADQGWLAQFARQPVRYLGLMGPRARREKLLASLEVPVPSGFFGPVGLDVAAEGASQIAVAIVAELLAVCGNRSGGHLKDRQAPIYERLGT